MRDNCSRAMNNCGISDRNRQEQILFDIFGKERTNPNNPATRVRYGGLVDKCRTDFLNEYPMYKAAFHFYRTFRFLRDVANSKKKKCWGCNKLFGDNDNIDAPDDICVSHQEQYPFPVKNKTTSK